MLYRGRSECVRKTKINKPVMAIIDALKAKDGAIVKKITIFFSTTVEFLRINCCEKTIIELTS